MNDLQQSHSIRIKLSLPLEIMTQLFVVRRHEIKYRQRKGKKDRRAFFFYIQIRKTILLPLTHWHVIRLSGFFTFLVLFSSPFTLRNLANNKVLCFYEKKWKERKPSAFHSTLLQERKMIFDVLRTLDFLRSFGRYFVLALQCFALVHISKRKKHYRAITSKTLQGHKDQNISNDLFSI